MPKRRYALLIVQSGHFNLGAIKESIVELFRTHERNGRSLGKMTFVKRFGGYFRQTQAKEAGSKEKCITCLNV